MLAAPAASKLYEIASRGRTDSLAIRSRANSMIDSGIGLSNPPAT